MKGAAEFHRNNFRKPCCRGWRMLFSSRCFIMLLTTLIHFAMMHVSETGRKLLGLCLSPFLKIGAMLAS